MAVNFYSNKLFSNYVSDLNATYLTNGVFVTHLLAGIAILFVANRWNRKTLLGLGYLTTAILLFWFGYLSSENLNDLRFGLQVFCLYGVIFIGGCSQGCVTWMMFADYLPDKAMVVATINVWVWMILMNSYLFPYAVNLEDIGISGCFYIFSGC